MKQLIKNGHVIDPVSGIDGVRQIVIFDGKIEAIEAGEISEDRFDTVIDASGLVVVPGLIDMHVHLREPGYEDKETIETGTMSAAAGGFTTIAAMPNTNPVIDNKMNVEFVSAKAKSYGHCNVCVVGAITKGLAGEELSEIGDLVEAGAVAISDDGKTVMNSEIMRRAMQYVKMFDIPIIVHCEDMFLSGDGVMNEGYNSTRFGLRGVTRLAEEVIVARDVMMAEKLGVRLHVAHVSTRDSVDIIRRAKERGVEVTCEATPHHFSLTDEELGRFDSDFKMSPPLRTADDIEALIEGMKDGTIDAIASDHAPHTQEEKDMELDYAPNGVIGLETTLTVSITNLFKTGILTLGELVEKMSSNPAKILGLHDKGRLAKGTEAGITIIDINEKRIIEPDLFLSKARNTPFKGFSGCGIAEYVFKDGKMTYRNRRDKQHV